MTAVRILERLVQLRFWVAAMITLLAAATAPVLGFPVSALALGIVFACSLGIYNADHVVDDEPGLGRWPLILTLGAAAVVTSLLAFSTSGVRWLVLGGLGASGLYFVPFRAGGRRLRAENLPGFKPLFIGVAVATASVLVPWLQAHPHPTSLSPALAALVVVRSLLCGANTLVFDLRDAEHDRARGVATAPLARGHRFTRWLVTCLLALATLGAWWSHAWGLSTARTLAAQSGTALGLGLAAWLLPERTPRVVFSLVVDGLLALPWLVTLVPG